LVFDVSRKWFETVYPIKSPTVVHLVVDQAFALICALDDLGEDFCWNAVC
jgi:hypothetical protein